MYYIKLGGAARMLEGRAEIEGDHSKLEKLAARNLLKFSEEKVLHLAWNNQPRIVVQAGA